MTRRLKYEVRNAPVPLSWLGRVLAGIVGFGLVVVAFLFFTALLIAAGALGIAFLLYLRHAQRNAQRNATDRVIEGEYTVEGPERGHDGQVSAEASKSRQNAP